jgi:uncharacterized protein involved in type VI secretion and phage assembly
MDMLSVLERANPRLARGFGGRFYGVYTAVVTEITDPDGQGRVRVKLPWTPDTDGLRYEVWARLATFMAGANRGSWFIPDVDDEVLVCFEAGDTRRPYIIGSLWNGRDDPPESMDGSGENNIKVLRSRNGVKVTLDDSSGRERMHLQTPGGQQLELKDGTGSIELRDSNGNSVVMDGQGITVNAAAKVTINGSLIEVSAGTVTVNAGMSRFSGVVQADTIISNSVISASYTPGAGNIW